MLGQSFPSLMQEWAFFLACVFIKCLKRTLAPSVLVDGTTSPPPGVFESVTPPLFSVVCFQLNPHLFRCNVETG